MYKMNKYKIQDFLKENLANFIGSTLLISTPIFRIKGVVDIVDNNMKEMRLKGVIDGYNFLGKKFKLKETCFCLHIGDMIQNYKMENIQVIIL